jgi:membrane-bound lytic murein transglycosylase B
LASALAGLRPSDVEPRQDPERTDGVGRVRPRRRRAKVVLIALVGVMGVALGLIVVVGALVAGRLANSDTHSAAPVGDGLVAADVPQNTPVPQPAALAPDTDLAVWADGVAKAQDLPRRAVLAYGSAELAQRKATPNCRLSWATLAGIGRVESHHGTIGPSNIDADGVARPPIIGVALDGSAGVRAIPDTDGGRLDGDTTQDRAVGPMQFLPMTWANYGDDGNGDGVRDPQQIDDAALATAHYLCADGRDTGSGQGWWDGVLTYNNSVPYGQLVWAAVNRYGAPPPAP